MFSGLLHLACINETSYQTQMDIRVGQVAFLRPFQIGQRLTTLVPAKVKGGPHGVRQSGIGVLADRLVVPERCRFVRLLRPLLGQLPHRLIGKDVIWMRLDDVYGRLIRSMDLRLEEGKRRLSSEYRALRLYSPIKMVNEVNQKLGFQKITFYRAMKNRLKDSRIDLSHLQKSYF